MAAACALGVEGVDGPAFHRAKRMFDKAGFIQRVGMDHHLHVHVVRDRQAAINRGGGGAPIFVQLQRTGPAVHHFDQRTGLAGIALAREADVHHHAVHCLQHAPDVPRAGGACGGKRAMCRAGAPAKASGHTGVECVLHLLGRDKVDVAVETAGGQDAPFAGDDLGPRSDDDINVGLGVGVARLANRRDAPVFQRDIRLVDARMIDDQRVGNHGIHRTIRPRDLRLAHAVTDYLAAAELHLFAIGRQIAFDLDDQIGVSQP